MCILLDSSLNCQDVFFQKAEKVMVGVNSIEFKRIPNVTVVEIFIEQGLDHPPKLL